MALSKQPPVQDLLKNRRIQLTALKALLEVRDILVPFRSVNEFVENTPTNYRRMVILFIVCLFKWRGYFKMLLDNPEYRNSPIANKCKIALIFGLFGHFLIYKSQLDVKQHIRAIRRGNNYNTNNYNNSDSRGTLYTREGLYGMVRYPNLTGAMFSAVGASIYMESKIGFIVSLILAMSMVNTVNKNEKEKFNKQDSQFEKYKRDVPYKFVPNIY